MDTLPLGEDLIFWLKGLSIPVLALILYTIVTLLHSLYRFTRNSRLHLRISKNRDCLLYKKKPKNTLYVGNVKNIKLKTEIPGRSIPDVYSIENEFWGNITIEFPGNRKKVSRNAFPKKDIERITGFMKNAGIQCRE